MEKTGIQNMKEVVGLILSGIAIVKESQADGKIGFDDVALLFKLIPELGPAVAGLDSIPAELSDLSEAEVAELAAFVISSQAGVADTEKAKHLIAGAFKVAGGVVEIIGGFKASV